MLGAIAVLVLFAELVSPVQNSTITTTTTTADPALVCVNDYLSTMYCSLNAPADTPPENGSDWLTFAGYYMEGHQSVRKTKKCMLGYAGGIFSCSVMIDRPDPFPDMISFQIERCHQGEPCVLLEKEHYPKEHIKPIAPSQLAVHLNSSEFHFSWDSSYGEYPASSPQTNVYFVQDLQYELWLGREGHEENPIKVSPPGNSFKAHVDRFAVNAEYRSRVRSSPDQIEYKGEWSQWSQETRFVTPGILADGKESNAAGLDPGLIIGLSLLAAVLLLLCSVTVLKLRKSTFIPTPVLRVSPLTNTYAGYIKGMEAPPSNGKALKETEQTAQVCVLTERVDVPEKSGDTWLHPRPGVGRADPCGGGQTQASPLGIPYAVTPMTDKVKGRWDPGNSAGTDSGCWHCSGTSMDRERDHRGYRNAYCTLANRQCDLDCESSTAGAPQSDPEHLARNPDYQNQGSFD